MKLNLVILAAGMGSRYGGLKQLDSMGPNGETVLDYSVYDAIRAGFRKVVFVIRKEFESAFIEAVGSKFEGRIEIGYAFQDLNHLPGRFTAPEGREKPWGTTHAVLAARNQVTGPFAVINADDFYGKDAYQKLADFFAQQNDPNGVLTSIVAYPLQNTLSENGSVNRGICSIEDGQLLSVEEHIDIRQESDGQISGENLQGKRIALPADSLVSMNFWGFSPKIFAELEQHFEKFLIERGNELKSECYLPTVVDALIQAEISKCQVLSARGQWFGVTYPSDKPQVKASIQSLIDDGDYPACLSTPT